MTQKKYAHKNFYTSVQHFFRNNQILETTPTVLQRWMDK